MTLRPELDDLLELRHQARALGLASQHLVNSALSGLYASVFRGQGLDFDEVRDYREGDDIRNMDWNITARTGVAHLKVFREERERTVMLCVDRGPHMSFGTRGTFKSIQAARAAALLGWFAGSHQDRVGGVLFGDPAAGLGHFQASRGRRALWRTLRALTEPSSTEPESENNDDYLLEALRKMALGVPKGALIFVIADMNREVAALEYALGRLCQHRDLVLLPVDDPADWDMPAMGNVLFRAPHGEMLALNTDSEPGRRAYREAWNARRQALSATANRFGVPLIPLLTHEDVHLSLLKGLRRRVKGRTLT